MRQYLNLMQDVLDNGVRRDDRTGTGTIAVFGRQMRFNLEDGFPVLTTKKLHLRSVIHELLWLLNGDTNIRYLQENGVRIWNDWADANGDLGPIYGEQWRRWKGASGQRFDQMTELLENLRKNPGSRRHIVSAWNVSEIGQMALAPCHTMFQFFVANGKLSCQLYARSQDLFLGTPFNIASYALLTHMIAEQLDLTPHEFVWTGGDVHLYLNHIEQTKEQLEREPLALPRLKIKRRPGSLFEYSFEDFELEGYEAHPHIKAPISV